MGDAASASQKAATLSAADPPAAADPVKASSSLKSSIPTIASNPVTSKARLATGIPSPSAPAAQPSPNSSRNTSPIRKTAGPPNTITSARAKSAALSPTRPGASTPSAAAVQRALSTNNTELLRPSRTAQLPAPKSAQKSDNGTTSKTATPPTPLSPRTKSPPSAASSRRSSLSSVINTDAEISEPSKSAQVEPSRTSDTTDGSASPALLAAPASAKAHRGPSGLGSKLETVEESDHSEALGEQQDATSTKKEDTTAKKETSVGDRTDARPTGKPESKNTQPEGKVNTGQPPARKKSSSSLAPAKTRSKHEGISGTMTVETETVSSIPHTAIGNPADRAGGPGGSLRARPSSETIRPKKDKKKPAKKPPSIISTVGKSNADIFEAKVASEIEGGGSDSDETFVYESNPHDSRSRSSRHHSRTPSTTSVHTLGDKPGHMKTLGNTSTSFDRPVRPRRSMKFASNSYASSSVDDDSTDFYGTVRASNPRFAPRQDPQTKHMSRISQHHSNSKSPVDGDSPFSQAAKVRGGIGLGSRRDVKSGSARSLTPTQPKAFSNRDSPSYDYDSTGIAGERSPLMGSLRTPRTRNGRHPTGSHLRHMEYYIEPRRSWIGRLIGCIVLTFIIVVLILFGAGVLFATARPLYGVSVQAIQNVLASEQELMLDLSVEATNPNVAQITITEMDMNVFAKSRHVSERSLYDVAFSGAKPRSKRPSNYHTRSSPDSSVRPRDGVDDGTDPIEDPDPEADRQTMLLGRIFQFDSSISFDASPIRREPREAIGEIRLLRPGNKTETGGSARWQRVIEHPFELIVRGVLKYQLPLSTHVVSSSVGARVTVHPEDGIDEKGSMRVVQIAHLPAFDVGPDE